MKQITLEGFNSPRIKPTYAELSEGSKLWVNTLADDFKLEIRSRLLIATSKQNLRFPISGNVSISLIVCTSRVINLFGVVKNVLDSMNGLIYTDDCAVSSILAAKQIVDNEDDVLNIQVISGTNLRSQDSEDQRDLTPFKVLDLQMRTLVVDQFLGYPSSPECSEVVIDAGDSELRKAIEDDWDHNHVDEIAGALSFCIETSRSRPDIDNICLNYLINLNGLAYRELTDITSLHMETRRKPRCQERAIIKVFGGGMSKS